MFRNEHRNGILFQTVTPAGYSEETERKARACAEGIAEKLGVVGLLAVEMFVLADGSVLQLISEPEGRVRLAFTDFSNAKVEPKAVLPLIEQLDDPGRTARPPSRRGNNHRDARPDLEQRVVLRPLPLLAEVVAVVAPEEDDRRVAEAELVQLGEHAADVPVGEAGAGPVGALQKIANCVEVKTRRIRTDGELVTLRFNHLWHGVSVS